ncbi:MAG: M48 family metallopeptidase [Hyphomonadaceae bacterium]
MLRFLILALLAWPFAGAAQAAAPAAFDPAAAADAWLATLGPEATARSNAYFEGGYWIGYASAALTIAVSLLMMILGWAKGVRGWLEKTVKFYVLVAFGMGLFYILVSSVLTFPFTWWVSFAREHEFGLSTQTFSEWLGEYLINFALSLVIGALFIAVLYLIVRAAKSAWWIWGAGVTMAFMIFVLAIAPVFVAPLFNTYTPMQEGPLRTSILQMAQANGVPADNVYVFDVSRQSNRVTANVSGMFGTTRISLSDTLLERVSPEGVRAVMGHELGHYALQQMASILLMLAALIAFVYALTHLIFVRAVRNERWGVRGVEDPAGLPLAFAIVTFLFALATPLNNNIIRYHEMQADLFGLNAAREPGGFAEAAVLLSEYRKMRPSPLEEWFFYDHPSGYTRIFTAMQWQAHEQAAGRYPQRPAGPPPGWRPDFVVMREGAALPAATPEPSPAAPSN